MRKVLFLFILLGCKNIRLENIKFKDREQILRKAFNIIKDNRAIDIRDFSEMIEEFKRDSNESITLNSLDENGKTLLHYAAEKGDQETICMLVESGAEINIKNKLGETPLHFLTHLENGTKMIEYLLNKGAYIESRTNAGNTPLHNACYFGNAEAFKILLKRGANTQALTGEGYNLLHCCILMGKDKMLEKLLKKESFKAFIERKDFQGKTPLHLACEMREEECAKVLIKHNASLDIEELNGYTPLQLACTSGSYEIVQNILEGKPENLNKKNKSGETILDTAIEFNRKNIIELISRKLKEAN